MLCYRDSIALGQMQVNLITNRNAENLSKDLKLKMKIQKQFKQLCLKPSKN